MTKYLRCAAGNTLSSEVEISIVGWSNFRESIGLPNPATNMHSR